MRPEPEAVPGDSGRHRGHRRLRHAGQEGQSWLDAESGLQSYESIRADFQDAVRDPRIHGILLDVDSPGGEVGGLFDLADEIYNAAG